MSVPTVRHAELVQSLAKQLKLPRQTVRQVLAGMVARVESELKNEKRVQIKGLGMLSVRQVSAGDGKADKATKKRVALVAARELKSAIEN